MRLFLMIDFLNIFILIAKVSLWQNRRELFMNVK